MQALKPSPCRVGMTIRAWLEVGMASEPFLVVIMLMSVSLASAGTDRVRRTPQLACGRAAAEDW